MTTASLLQLSCGYPPPPPPPQIILLLHGCTPRNLDPPVSIVHTVYDLSILDPWVLLCSHNVIIHRDVCFHCEQPDMACSPEEVPINILKIVASMSLSTSTSSATMTILLSGWQLRAVKPSEHRPENTLQR